MTRDFIHGGFRIPLILGCLLLAVNTQVQAQAPNPVLDTVFPAGGKAGTTVTVTLSGSALDGLRDIHTTIPKLAVKKLDANRFSLTVPADTPPGVYDLRAVGTHGMSSPRTFVVGNRAEVLEDRSAGATDSSQEVSLDNVVNGRIEAAGNVDRFKFTAKAGQRVVLDCSAERIDSKLRAVLEIHDANGKRLAVSRGHSGIDPLIDFRVPADGIYVVKVFDLSYLGSPAHFYRLDIDTKPRVEFAFPCVLTRGKTTKVKLFGRNLTPREKGKNDLSLDCVEVEMTPPKTTGHEPIPMRFRAAQLPIDGFAYHYPETHAPILMSVTDVPVLAAADNHSSEKAQEITVPSEVCGQLTEGDERHWYAVRARRGEVLWLETFGSRIGSPVDLAMTVHDSTGNTELKRFTGSLDNLGVSRFPADHPDPVGRWVAPTDGRFLIQVRNLTGGLKSDPRRLYRLSVRREEPDFHLAVLSPRAGQPAGLNLMPGGREMLEVLAIRQRGMSGPIRVTAENLPPGIQCPDIWIGPGQDRGVVVLSASRDCKEFAGGLKLVGHAEVGDTKISRPVKGGTFIHAGQPSPSGRLTQEIPLATTREASLLMTASPSKADIDQESVLDVAIDLEQRLKGATGPTHLTVVGLPRSAGKHLATIPAGKTRGWICVAFPASLPPGPYTFAVQAETSVPVAGSPGAKPAQVSVVSNPITVNIRPARIVIEVDPRTPAKIARGKIIQLRFTAERKHGFIGKIHTELVAPGGVIGLRARGVTLVGQSDSGTLQVIATEDAPLGRHVFLRLDAIGTVEDQPVYRASRFVELEITE
jgi:hypothetical protein